MAERSKLEQIQIDLNTAKEAGNIVIAGQFFHLSINPGFAALGQEEAYKEEVMFFVAPAQTVEISGDSLNNFFRGLTSVRAPTSREFFGGKSIYDGGKPYYEDLQLGLRQSYEYIPGGVRSENSLKPQLLDPEAQLRAEEAVAMSQGVRILPAQRAISLYYYPHPAPAECAFLYTSAVLTGFMPSNPELDELYKTIKADAVKDLTLGRDPYSDLALTIPRPPRRRIG